MLRFACLLLLASVIHAAEPINVTLVDGNQSTVDLNGTPTLAVFWASWCAPCNAEAPAITALAAAHPDDLRLVSVSVDENTTAAQGFITQHQLSGPVVHDPELALADQWRVHGTPTLIVFGADGTELARGSRLNGAVQTALDGLFAAP